ncbi:FAD-binding oxidoreductase [Brevibacterium sp. K11IcPPYGO002]|uniref:FAD-binding oxidoreductase n=1 Tax=Brevibacterium sp. K11IcPPYGO002 TaxID=3058837 RepID=UPI003D819ECE
MSEPMRMQDVKRHRWWGWGAEGVDFRWETKPDFAAIAKDKVGLDLWNAPRPTTPVLSDLTIPESRMSSTLLDELGAVVESDNVSVDDELRVIHSFGRSLPDLYRVRHAPITRLVDAVVYPGSEDEIAAVLALVLERDLVLIPYGGGSCISGSVTPSPDEERPIVSLNLGRMRRVIDIDEYSGLARVEAGAYGPDLEEQLNLRGWTMGHFPDSFSYSTLGGWAATRSSGMQSDKYGDIEDIVRGLRVVHPRGVMVSKPIPGRDSGPSVHEMVLGSEGRLGVISECTVQVHRLPKVRQVIAYLFPDWASGVEAMHDIARSEVTPAFTRLSDGPETRFSLAMVSEPKGVKATIAARGQDALFAYLRSKGWDTTEGMCLSYVCFEGSKERVAREKAEVKELIARRGGISLGSGPGAVYDQKKFDTPYLRDFLLNYKVFGDVCETGVTWGDLKNVHARVHERFRQTRSEQGGPGFMFCHLSHSYHGGACLYFTFAIPYTDEDTALAEYQDVKDSIQQEFIDSGGGLSHHHGVGTEHQPWLVDDISEPGAFMVDAVFRATDPGQNLNPGKVLGDRAPS